MKDVMKNILSWISIILVAFLIVFVLKTFIGMPTTIKGTSMFSTLVPEEKVFVTTWRALIDSKPKRGEVITFEAPSVGIIKESESSNPRAIYYKDNRNIIQKVMYHGLGITDRSYVKRVIGVEDDHVEIKERVCIYKWRKNR